jgi:hypothetical protein
VIHPVDCDCDTYGCELRRKGLGFSSTATPTTRVRRPWRQKVNASWEAGKAGEHRPGGTFMPYIGDQTGRHVRMKEAAERRSEISEIRRAREQAPALKE